MDKSEGHLGFADGFEFFLRNGNLYQAPLSDVIMPDGYRTGRWEGKTQQQIDYRLGQFGILACLENNELI